MLKDVTETLVCYSRKSYETGHLMLNIVDSEWQEICKWPTETRYVQYDRFSIFVATVCYYAPEQAKKGRYVV